MSLTRLVDFVVLGAQKSGTTTLHHSLDLHPDIFMSRPVKESRFFYPVDRIRWHFQHSKWSDQAEHLRSHDDVLRYLMMDGYQGEAKLGESTTTYTQGETARELGLAKIMRCHNPNMRFVYIVRNPFDRIVSNFRHDRRKHDFRSLSEYLESPLGRVAVLTSCYAYQLQAYLSSFNLDRFLVVNFDKLLHAPGDVLTQVHSHIKVEPQAPTDRLHLNVAKRQPNEADDMQIARAKFDPIYSKIMRDVDRFVALTGLDISTWNLEFETWLSPQF